MNKCIFFILLILLSCCSYKLKEKNELLIPPVFRQEYNEYSQNKYNLIKD